MKTNLINNFIHMQNTPPSKKEVPEFDIHHELQNKTFIRPLKGQGRLVKGNIFDAPATMVKGLSYDVNALRHGLNGEANDHQLGKLNDVGMKIGGLAIAGYLFTKRQSPLTKTMEFVGLGSFFASMALWPKIALQLPARLIHGFNVQQQYEDSFGRKKPFYQDPQFLPWDLYSDDEINKIGNRMGVPKDIQNRREFIQEKMKKIAIQNNTLWMLTAGFATPIMSALICNQLEKPLSKPLSAMRNSNNNNILSNFKQVSKDLQDNRIKKNVQKIVSINQNKPLTKNLIREISIAMTDGYDPHVTNAVTRDLQSLLGAETYVINHNTVNAIVNESQQVLQKLNLETDVIDKILPTSEQLTEYFDVEKGFFGNDYNSDDIERIFTEYSNKLRSQIDEYNKANPQKPISPRQKTKIIKNLITAQSENNPIMKGLTKERHAVLNTGNLKLINIVTEALNNLKADLNAADKYLLHQLGMAPETTVADLWNETVDIFIKGLKITPKQIEQTRGDRLLVKNLLRTSYDNIASDKKQYNTLITSLIHQIAEINKRIKQTDVNDQTLSQKKNLLFDNKLNEAFKNFEKKIKSIPSFKEGDMEFLFNKLLGSRPNLNIDTRNSGGSLIELYKLMPKTRLVGVKSSFFRILNSLDLHRRIAVGDSAYTLALHSSMPRETKEVVTELSKSLGISGHTCDYLTKFFKAVNPNPNPNDTSAIELKNGKTIYRYYNPKIKFGKVNQPQDINLFIESMRLQYQNSLLNETEDAFGKQYENLLAEFKTYRDTLYKQVGNKNYFESVLSKVDKKGISTASDREIFDLIGAATDKMVASYGKQTFNTNKWLKMFGTMGAALLAITVGAQFFFGRMKPPKTTETQKG